MNSPFHGWLIIDKPEGMTSTKVGSIIKRITGVKKIGHAGTLDPFATGVLPLALGEATKVIPYLHEGKKSYIFEAVWGEKRDTDDKDGQVVAKASYQPTQQEIKDIIPQFCGTITQIPPAFSALKIAGERAYDLARRGENPDLKERQVTIHQLKLLQSTLSTATFQVYCSTGTYVRALARDMAERLGTLGYLRTLRRVKVGIFEEAHTISLEKLNEIKHNSEWQTYLKPLETVLDDIPAVLVSAMEVFALKRGQPIVCTSSYKDNAQFKVTYQNKVIGIVSYETGQLHPKRNFNI